MLTANQQYLLYLLCSSYSMSSCFLLLQCVYLADVVPDILLDQINYLFIYLF